MSLTRTRPRSQSAPVMLQSSALAERLRQERAAKAGTTIAYFDWAMKVPEPKAGKLNFDVFRPQLELYQEGANDKAAVVQKATQIGMSAWAIRWALYHADTKGQTGLYVFPTQRDMYDFSTLRIQPLVNGSKYLAARRQPDDPNNKGMMGVGLGVMVFRGSNSEQGLDSVDIDHIVFDEYDTLDHTHIPDAEMRVSSPLSPGLIRRVGVPSDPDWGISKLYDESDQRVWLVKCGRCGHDQELDFWENVDLVTAKRVCSKCRKSIEADLLNGRWVPKFPERDVRGYHMSRLIFAGASMSDAIAMSKKRNPREMKVFHNKHLGLPFAEASGRLSKEAITAAQREYETAGGAGYAGTNLVTMGVDVASARDLNVRVSEHISETEKKALFIGTVDSFNELALMMDRYKVKMCCVDHLPDGRLAMSFAERFAGRVMLVSYDGTQTARDPEVIKVNEEMRHVRVRRTEAIDATLESIRQQTNLLPQNLPEGWVAQMQANVRFSEEDETGKKVVGYKKRGEDDFLHAEVYDLVACEVWWMRQGLEELQRDQFNPLDDMLEFQRSGLASMDDVEYSPGGGREDYYGG